MQTWCMHTGFSLVGWPGLNNTGVSLLGCSPQFLTCPGVTGEPLSTSTLTTSPLTSA